MRCVYACEVEAYLVMCLCAEQQIKVQGDRVLHLKGKTQ